MTLSILETTLDEAEGLFAYDGPDGTNGKVTRDAINMACNALRVDVGTELQWHIPDVFDVRYGSCYVATARHGDNAVRFVTDEGTWQEGDDK